MYIDVLVAQLCFILGGGGIDLKHSIQRNFLQMKKRVDPGYELEAYNLHHNHISIIRIKLCFTRIAQIKMGLKAGLESSKNVLYPGSRGISLLRNLWKIPTVYEIKNIVR